MTLGRLYYTHFKNYLLVNDHQSTKIFFCKSLYVFLFLKIIFLWSVLPDITKYVPFQFNSLVKHVVYAPIKIAQIDLLIFLALFLVVLLISIIVKMNYISAIIIFWLSISLSRLALPVTNGSDLVLNLFLLISIFIPAMPLLKSPGFRWLQKIIANFAFLLCQTQLALIYLLSGFDKLMSEAWRSGDAMFSILNLEYFINPLVSAPVNKSFYIITAWITIIFELGFAVLIWVKPFRWPLLITGIIFHLSIVFFLSLPDFGILMILTYSLFIPFKDRSMAVPDKEM